METWTIIKLINWSAKYLDSRLETEILLAYVLHLKRLDLYLQFERILSQPELEQFKALLQRRKNHEPIAYIVGYQPFMGLDFIVTPDVLIPRPETELLVETAIELITNYKLLITSLTDFGTGSGCIAISLAKRFPDLKIIATDASDKALAVTKQNAKKHGVTLNLSSPFPTDLIISNPPYIPTADIDKLGPDVKDFEPRLALDGGPDGLDFIRQLIGLDFKFLVLEFGINQGQAIRALAEDQGKEIKIIKDYAGTERIAVINAKSS